MSLLLIGANHKTAPVELRERLAVGETDVAPLLSEVKGIPGVNGASVLSTCNRFELLVSTGGEDIADRIVSFEAKRASLPVSSLERHFYILRDGDVVRHVFRVAAGLDSMVMGEPQIAGQVKAAYRLSSESRSLDSVLRQLYEHTFRVAKRVRNETGIGENAVSIPFAAVELARKIFGELDGLEVLILGAGKIGELTTKNLHSLGMKKVFVANRHFERAAELAKQFEGTAIPFDSVADHLLTCDVLIASTSAPQYVLDAGQVRHAMQKRGRRDLFLIDLSVPRNLDPAISSVDGAFLYNIDDLKEVVTQNRELRKGCANDADAIIERESEEFLRRLASLDVIPTIVELKSRLEEIRASEVEKCLRRLGPVSTEQREAIEILSTSIINKVLHYPVVRLRESAAEARNGDGPDLRDTIRRIFGL